MVGLLIMEEGRAMSPTCSCLGGVQEFERGDVAAERCDLFARGVCPDGSAGVAGSGEMLGICFREAVDLVRAAMARASGAVFAAFRCEREGQRSKLVDDDPVVRGDHGTGAGREAGFDLFSRGAEVGDQGSGAHSVSPIRLFA